MHFSQFINLKIPGLFYYKVGKYIKKFVFADSIERLNLDSNEINSIKKVVTPPKLLKFLDVNNNEIKSLTNVGFLDTLEVLTGFHNNITEVDFSKNDIKSVILSGSKTEFSYPKFTNSSNVQYLDSLGCNVNNFQIQDTLIGLHLRYCHFGTPEELNFRMQSSLKHSYLINCPLSNANISFPQSLDKASSKSVALLKLRCCSEI